MKKRGLKIEKESINTRCPVCFETVGHTLVEKWHEYTIWHCSYCDVVFSEPMEHPGRGFYNGEVEEPFVKRIYQLRDSGVFFIGPNHKWALKNLPVRSGSLLDIGCGNGSFVLYARQKGFDPWGIDLSANAIEAGERHFGLNNIFACGFEEFRQKVCSNIRFDVVSFFEVLEHMDDPNDFVNTVKNLMKPGGLIALSVPNRERHLSDILVSKIGDSPPHHFTRWSKKALVRFLERNGFVVMKISTVPTSCATGCIMDYFLGTDKISAKVATAAVDKSSPISVRLGFYLIRTVCHAVLKTFDIFLYPLHRKACLVAIAKRMDQGS